MIIMLPSPRRIIKLRSILDVCLQQNVVSQKGLCRCLSLAMLQVISKAVYASSPSLRQAGMEFAVWTFKHGASDQLEKAAPEVLKGLLAQLENGQLLYTLPYIGRSGMGSHETYGFPYSLNLLGIERLQ